MNIDIFKEIENKKNTAEAFKLGVVDIRQVAASFEFLERVKSAATAAQSALQHILLNEEVEELFPEMGSKVVFVKGSRKTMLQPEIVQKFCTPVTFSKVVSVSEKKIKTVYQELEGKGFSEKAEVIIAKAKKETGIGSSSVSVKSMTKKELSESSK